MGQTLTHGVYLPDKGERNCYSGLAANWQILDGSVGTIAAHTAALAGKAPLVHTHTKSDITDFPVLANVATSGSYNDLSNIPASFTPASHTHGKADITDLFNSANTWSGDNTFSKAVGFTKVNATTLYAQNARVELGDSGLSGDSYNQISFWDKNGDNVSYLRQTYNTDGTNTLNIFVRNKFLNGVPNTAGTVDYAYFGIILGADKSKQAVFKANLRPYDSTYAYSLGDSTYKWKTLNGVNPGALSLPSENASSVNLDPTNWNTTGTNYNAYIPPSDGWLAIQVQSADVSDLTGQYVFIGRSTGGNDFYPQAMLSNLVGDFTSNKLNGAVMMPVISGKTYHIRVKIGKTQQEGSVILVRFYPCQGNV